MKITKLILIQSLALALLTTSAYADEDDAQAICERWVSDYHDPHCSYASGLESGTDIGRYIKEFDSQEDRSFTRCVTAYTVVNDIYPELAEDYLGSNRLEYSICTDAKGEHCEPIGIDYFTVEKVDEVYLGTPTFYNLDLTGVKDKYPECMQSDLRSQSSLKRPFHQMK